METYAVLALYDRFVTPENANEKLVMVDDTDPGYRTTDHVDSPWVWAAVNQLMSQFKQTLWDRYRAPGSPVIAPFSKKGPTLILYWQGCEKPEVVSREESNCFQVTMPNGRMAVLYYEDDEKLVMKAYYAW